jgi:hypothetical protein
VIADVLLDEIVPRLSLGPGVTTTRWEIVSVLSEVVDAALELQEQQASPGHPSMFTYVYVLS